MNNAPILLLEDDELVATLFTTALEHAGYSVICANNSKHIRNLFTRHQPRLLITDLIMPDHEGMEAIFQLREMSAIPIIAISTNTTYLRMAEPFVTRILAKPFPVGFLVENVRQVLP